MAFSWIDWLITAAYFLVLIGIGFGLRRRAGRSLADFFVSGRSLPWWIAGTSMVATTFAADTPLAVTGLVAKDGLAGNWVWWSFALGGMLTVFVYARLWRRAEVMTDVELVELRYGGRPAVWLRGIRAGYLALLINPIIVGWVTMAMVTVLKETVLYGLPAPGWLGGLPLEWLVIVGLLGVVGLYATLAGMWGVALTDFFQFIAAMIGCTLLAIVAVDHVGGLAALQEKVASRFPDGEQAFRFIPEFGGEQAWLPFRVFLIFLLVQWWATWYPGAEPGGGGFVVQRMASCKSEGHAVAATLWYQLAHYCLRPWPWLLVAFVALVLYPDVRQLAIDPALREATGQTAGVGFARVIRELSPEGLRGLMLVTFLSAYMSTISTQMNWGASYLVRDVYQRFLRPEANEQQLTRMSRWASVAMLALGGGASVWMIESRMSVEEAWKLLLALGAGTGAVFMLRWFWWRINAWSEISAMVASLVYFVILQQWSARRSSEQPILRGEEAVFLIAIATMVTWLVVTLLTRPEPQETLLNFYRKIRPGGPGWRPQARLAPEVQRDRHLGLSLTAAVLASGVVYFTLPGIGLLLFGQIGQGVLLLAGAAGCGIAVWLLLRWIGDEQLLS